MFDESGMEWGLLRLLGQLICFVSCLKVYEYRVESRLMSKEKTGNRC